MAWVATDKNKYEFIYASKPHRAGHTWMEALDGMVCVPNGTIKKLIGRDLAWEDEAVELPDTDVENETI